MSTSCTGIGNANSMYRDWKCQHRLQGLEMSTSYTGIGNANSMYRNWKCQHVLSCSTPKSTTREFVYTGRIQTHTSIGNVPMQGWEMTTA